MTGTSTHCSHGLSALYVAAHLSHLFRVTAPLVPMLHITEQTSETVSMRRRWKEDFRITSRAMAVLLVEFVVGATKVVTDEEANYRLCNIKDASSQGCSDHIGPGWLSLAQPGSALSRASALGLIGSHYRHVT